jgi:2-polyprenyl-6-methoxyphenol hydroxylase-like FAD-dependent oxidoreductase
MSVKRAYESDNRRKAGYVIHALAIQDSLERGLEVYDFLASDSEEARYKQSLSSTAKRLAWARFHRPTVRGKVKSILGQVRRDLRHIGKGVQRMNQSDLTFDVAIIGAGFAGVATAAILGRKYRVALIDPLPEQPPSFKAEKIEPDQAESLRRLGLADHILPRAARIHAVQEARNGKVQRVVPLEQYGMLYQDMVNSLRESVPAGVATILSRAADVDTSAESQSVKLSNGAVVTCRLIVLASGVGGRIYEKIGADRKTIRNSHSVTTGFDIARKDGTPFPFEALTYWSDSRDSGIDYVSLFQIPGAMRVNMFSYRDRKDPWVHALGRSVRDVLDQSVPKLTQLIGDWEAVGKVENRPVDLYVSLPAKADGVVLIGDASQSVCPATGTGLTKVLADVEALCMTHVPNWFASEGMTAAKIASFYADPRKIETDRESLGNAEYRRKRITDESLVWRLKRQKARLREFAAGLRARLRLARGPG